jgi:nucleoside-diphosphate-sugar epimerase
VLVTGASGFVGGAVCARLREREGATVLGLGRRALADATGLRAPGAPGLPEACDYRRIDLAAPDAAARLAGLRFVPDAIVHAAARAEPWGTRSDFQRQNLAATRRIVEFASSLPHPPRLVFLSSASVLYRARDQLGVPNDAPAGPRYVNEYARTKHEAERVVHGYGGEWAVLRPRAVFGPGDTTLLPRIVDAARRGALPRFRTPRGRVVLSDLVYIDTLVEYIVRALDAPASVIAGRTLTVTNAEPVELAATVRDILARIGAPAPARTVSRRGALATATLAEGAWRLLRRPGEPPISRYSVIVYAFAKTFDVSECRALLGEPAVSIADGIDRLVAWHTGSRADRAGSPAPREERA